MLNNYGKLTLQVADRRTTYESYSYSYFHVQKLRSNVRKTYISM